MSAEEMEAGQSPTMRYTSPFSRPAEPAPAAETAEAPQAPPPAAHSRRPMAVAAAAAAVLVVGAGAAGAAIAHEFWSTAPAQPAAVADTSPSTLTPAQTPSSGSGTGSFGGSGSSGSGSSGSSGIPGGPTVTPNGRGGFSVRGGGYSITVGPNGVSFGNTGSGASAAAGPANAAGIAAKVSPALVNINVTNSFAGDAGAGTGIVVSSDGEVLTNNHVIDGATHVTATDVGNGRTYEATVVGYDPSHDVAVLELQGASGLQTATLGDSSKLAVGDRVLGMGNAGGAGGAPSTAGGSVTGLDKSITAGEGFGGRSEQLSGLIQTNAAVEPGDSGGPLVDAKGEVVGMVTAGSGGLGGGFGFQQPATQSYAVPIDVAKQVASQITSGHGSATVHIGASAFLGVRVGSSGSFGLGGFGGGSSTPGVTIGGVVSGQAAEKAGLSAGDVITSIDGRSISSPTQLSSLLLGHHPGDTVKVSWTDTSGQSRSASVRLGSGPPA